MPLSRRLALASSAAALSLDQDTRPKSENESNPAAAVRDWIRQNAIPFRTPVPGSSLDDLEPLRKVVANARVVALGEATHGTSEFFQLKHRMLEFLVSQMGFSIFSLEAGMPEADRLNDFVSGGEGDPAELLDGPLSQWKTQEILNMVLWMRELNTSGKGHIAFSGFDMQNPMRALENVRQFAGKRDSEFAATFDRAARMVRSFSPQSTNPAADVEWNKVVGYLESLRPQKGFEWTLQNARIVQQFMNWAAQLANGPVSMAIRDASMAANVKWILDQAKDAKVVLSCHNFHAMTGPLYPNQPGKNDSMGAVLRDLYGEDLVTFGFVFNRGSFRARGMNGTLQDFSVAPLPAGSLDASLAESGLPLFALDLRAAPRDGPVSDWLGSKLQTRNIMAGFSKDAAGFTIFEQVVRERYDCLVFVDRTTAARPPQKG
jgi:erythromycin esterase